MRRNVEGGCLFDKRRSEKPEACRNADVVSTAGRLNPNVMRSFPATRSTHAIENKPVSYPALDWRAACFLLLCQEAKTTCQRQRHTSEANKVSPAESAKKASRKFRT